MTTLSNFAAVDQTLFRQEELILEATELISSIMQENNISKAELARRLGKSKAFITQCLTGQQNLTLRTLADLLTALEYKASLGAEPSAPACKVLRRLYPINAWAFESSAIAPSDVIDCSASMALPEEEICDAA